MTREAFIGILARRPELNKLPARQLDLTGAKRDAFLSFFFARARRLDVMDLL